MSSGRAGRPDMWPWDSAPADVEDCSTCSRREAGCGGGPGRGRGESRRQTAANSYSQEKYPRTKDVSLEDQRGLRSLVRRIPPHLVASRSVEPSTSKPAARIPPSSDPSPSEEEKDRRSSSGVARQVRRPRFLKAAAASLFCGIGPVCWTRLAHHNLFTLHTSLHNFTSTLHITSSPPVPNISSLSPAAASRTLHRACHRLLACSRNSPNTLPINALFPCIKYPL